MHYLTACRNVFISFFKKNDPFYIYVNIYIYIYTYIYSGINETKQHDLELIVACLHNHSANL